MAKESAGKRHRSPGRKRISRARLAHHHLAIAVKEDAARKEAEADLEAAEARIREATDKFDKAAQFLGEGNCCVVKSAEELRIWAEIKQ